MPTRRAIAFCFALALLFWIANRASYKGYFSGDDLAAIALMRQVSFSQWLTALVTPVFNPNNFRPTGYALYGLLDRGFGLNFTPYLATVQILHGIVTLLVYTLARRFGATAWAATIGALFFTFHMALFGAFWKPMYNFDILCALFVILSILAWLRTDGWLWWLASFVSFWLAYKSKEVAVMLPAVLLLIEAQGKRRWLLLAPFFAVSLSFGVQAMLTNQTGAYHLTLSQQALAATASFYADHVMLARWGILALLVILALARTRWPLTAAILFLMPMLAVPGRTAAVYLYLPMVFLAMLVASATERIPKVASVALVVWVGLNFAEMRRLRSGALTDARQARAYTETILRNFEKFTKKALFFDGYPPSLDIWGAEAVLNLGTPANDGLDTEAELGPAALLTPGRAGLHLSWQPREERLYLFGLTLSNSYLDMSTGTNVHIGDGWYEPEALTRWTKPAAGIHLAATPETSVFECKILVPDQQLAYAHGEVNLELLVNGESVSKSALRSSGWTTIQVKWVPNERRSFVRIDLKVTPAFKPDPNGRELGVAVGAIGFR